MFACLQKSGLKVNAGKSCFGAHKFEYLGYHVTCDGVMPHTKESWGHSIPCSPKDSQIIAPVHQYNQFLSLHVTKILWASWPINCFNLQERQILVERRAPKVFWCNQTCDGTWIIAGLPGLQCSVLNTYWCFQTTNWCSHIPKEQANCFLFTKYEQLPTKLYHK